MSTDPEELRRIHSDGEEDYVSLVYDDIDEAALIARARSAK